MIPYRIDSGPGAGHQASIKVPAEDYTPDTVERLIEDQVSTTHAIGQLGRGSAAVA